ncbi:hypothetical protein AVEN_148375-1 [Araneus ventricosus]|uniref:Uncharacterized protein n=1 Tax=Araneus ventricosus TaxID=182803 RepID=A0A4Y2QJM8_ARAVE|nr:hypothetical protein AVEN_148375-1 [Araneus ventricosus]
MVFHSLEKLFSFVCGSPFRSDGNTITLFASSDTNYLMVTLRLCLLSSLVLILTICNQHSATPLNRMKYIRYILMSSSRFGSYAPWTVREALMDSTVRYPQLSIERLCVNVADERLQTDLTRDSKGESDELVMTCQKPQPLNS